MPTQSIIVYRNPMEAAMWESGLVGPLLLSGVVFVISLVCLHSLAERLFRLQFVRSRMKRGWGVPSWASYICMAISLIPTWLVFTNLANL